MRWGAVFGLTHGACRGMSVADRLLAYSIPEPNSGCRLYLGALTELGYGSFTVQGERDHLAHRWAYRVFVGPIPDGLTIDHLCRTRACIEPSHMEAVTLRVNILRGNNMAARHARRTECNQGHPFTPENTYMRPNNEGRACRICIRIRSKQAYQRIRGLQPS